MKITLILLFILSFEAGVFAQKDLPAIEKQMARYSDYLVNADQYEHRKFANKKFRSLFEVALDEIKSFEYPFDSLLWISKLVASDSSFRVFSWQLTKSNTEREYFGYLQLKSGEVFRLLDNKEDISDLEYSTFSDNDWYGQIYYKIINYNRGDDIGYILFGYKLIGDHEKVKVAMPIELEKKSVHFGKEIFKDTISGFKTLIALRTASTAASSLNYNPNKDMIIFDHTISLMIPDMKGKLHLTNVPDGSYHGYKWNGKYWDFIDKVFNQKFEEPPVDKKHQRNEKGLFGD